MTTSPMLPRRDGAPSSQQLNALVEELSRGLRRILRKARSGQGCTKLCMACMAAASGPRAPIAKQALLSN